MVFYAGYFISPSTHLTPILESREARMREVGDYSVYGRLDGNRDLTLMKKEATKNSVTEFAVAENSAAMRNLVDTLNIKPLEIGDLVEGSVLTMDSMTMYVEIPLYGTGIIYGQEYINARDMIKNINVGDTIKGKIIERENEDGYIE